MRIRKKTSTRRPYITLCASLALTFVLAASAPYRDVARAEDAPRTDPPRWLALASVGMPMRLTVDEDYGQDRWGSSYMDLLAGYVLPGASYRHGFGLGVAWNLSHDGGYVAPIYTADQVVLMPSYLGYVPLGRHFTMLAHLGLPISLINGAGFGLELGDAIVFNLLAGMGIFVEAAVTAFSAGDAGFTLLASGSAGIVIDYEVLP